MINKLKEYSNSRRTRLLAILSHIAIFSISISCLREQSYSSKQKNESKKLLATDKIRAEKELFETLSTRGQQSPEDSVNLEKTFEGSIPLPQVIHENLVLSQDCNLAQDLPVPTHWSEKLQKIEAGASGQIQVVNPHPEDDGEIKYYYNHQFLPTDGSYLGNNFSTLAVSNSEASEWIKKLCSKTKQAFRFFRPNNFNGINAINDIISHVPQKSGIVVIVNGLRNSKSMFAIFLPANWQLPSSHSTQNTPYPILFNGYYDLNDNIFHLEGESMGNLIAKSAQNSGTGAIGILWNGQGASASRTINPEAWSEFQQIIDLVQKLGGDPHRILGFGASRGGVTPLQMASNPNPHNYTFRYIDSAVPPAHYGTVTKLTSPTTPLLLFATEWTTGITGSHKKSFIYPDLNNNNLKGLNGFSAHLKILTNYSNHELADAKHSLGAESFIKSLKNSGTQIFLELASHDIIVPSFDPLWLYHQYVAAGIPIELKYNYLSGHYSDNPVRDQRIEKQLQIYTHIKPGEHPKVINGAKTFYKVNPFNKKLELASTSQFLFTLEVPRYISPEMNGLITVTGIPLTIYEIDIKFPDGKVKTITGTINSFGYNNYIFNSGDFHIGAHIVDSVRIKKPGMISWKSLSFSNHSFLKKASNEPLIIENLPNHPSDNGSVISNFIINGYLGNDRSRALGPFFHSVSYGIVE